MKKTVITAKPKLPTVATKPNIPAIAKKAGKTPKGY